MTDNASDAYASRHQVLAPFCNNEAELRGVLARLQAISRRTGHPLDVLLTVHTGIIEFERMQGVRPTSHDRLLDLIGRAATAARSLDALQDAVALLYGQETGP